jgi:putative membrane protein
LQNDIKIISDRFLMLEKKLKKLPYYFIEEVGVKLLCKEENVKKLILRVALKQNEIYSALSF